MSCYSIVRNKVISEGNGELPVIATYSKSGTLRRTGLSNGRVQWRCRGNTMSCMRIMFKLWTKKGVSFWSIFINNMNVNRLGFIWLSRSAPRRTVGSRLFFGLLLALLLLLVPVSRLNRQSFYFEPWTHRWLSTCCYLDCSDEGPQYGEPHSFQVKGFALEYILEQPILNYTMENSLITNVWKWV